MNMIKKKKIENKNNSNLIDENQAISLNNVLH